MRRILETLGAGEVEVVDRGGWRRWMAVVVDGRAFLKLKF